MANAILYYRTPTTRTIDGGGAPPLYEDPQNLPVTQILEFVFPDDIMEGVRETYQNNIKTSPVPNQDGVRKINVQENGLTSNSIVVRGVFKKNAGVGIQRLKDMRLVKQVDTYHQYGVFGIEIDTAPQFNIDPDDQKGLHIISTDIGYAGQAKTRYDFTITLGFGGTVI